MPRRSHRVSSKSRNPKSRRKSRGKSKPKAGSSGKYGLILHKPPRELSATELAVLMSTTVHLSTVAGLPGFDPTSVHVQLTFPSGRVGCANLALGTVPPGVVLVVEKEEEGETDVSSEKVQETKG